MAAARLGGCLGALGLLSACAGSHHITASQEAARYEESARSNYVAPGPARDPWGPYIQEASARYDVPERWIREVMRVESGGRTELNGQPITSGAGAMGLMQVMPATYDELRARYALGSDPYDPHNSILAGTAYIRELYDLYGSPGFLAAYNGGPGRLDDFLTRNRPLPDETRRYVAKIGPYITDSFPNKRSVAEQYAMNSLPASIPAGPRYPDAGVTATAAYAPPPPVAPPIASPPVASPPVEVAYAPPSAGDGAFDPPPGWTPVTMGRSAVASYVPPPGEPPAPEPAPFASSIPMPAEPPPAYADTAQPRALVTRPPQPRPPERSQVAAQIAPQTVPLPEPPPYVPSVQTASAYAPQTLQHHEQGFRLVPVAQAAPAPLYRGSNGQWAIQVGAFGNEGLAAYRRRHPPANRPPALWPAHALPWPASGSRTGTLYRARLVGLSRDAASQACERLARGRTNCIVLSPEAQN